MGGIDVKVEDEERAHDVEAIKSKSGENVDESGPENKFGREARRDARLRARQNAQNLEERGGYVDVLSGNSTTEVYTKRKIGVP